MGQMAGILGSVGGAGLGIVGSTMDTIGNVMAKDVQAKQLDVEARSVLDQAAFAERQQRRQGQIYMSENTAETASSGVDIRHGSPLFLALDQAKQNELQALSIRRAGQVGYNQLKFSSQMTKRQIPFDIARGILGGISGGLSGGGGSILSSLAK